MAETGTSLQIHVSVSRVMKSRTCVLAAALFIALTAAFGAQTVPPGERHVILVTIDGMRGDYLGDADRYHLRSHTPFRPGLTDRESGPSPWVIDPESWRFLQSLKGCAAGRRSRTLTSRDSAHIV
jgi:hypothetical protein